MRESLFTDQDGLEEWEGSGRMRRVPLSKERKTHLWIWFAWLAVFYGVWALLVERSGGWAAIVGQWPIAATMAFGSYVAGSTPMGGGTVAFPVLVLLFDEPVSLGRDFSFAIQSIGMTSASIFILCRRMPLARAMLSGAVLGSVVGTPLGIVWIAPVVPAFWIKMVFATMWAAFGVMHLVRFGEISRQVGMNEFNERWDFRVGAAVGFFSGVTVVAVTGVGVDMLLYAALVLLCRADPRIAIPTSVLIMAFNSLLGVAVKVAGGGLQPGVYEKWLAAAPVVALGAPLGAFLAGVIGRRTTMVFVSVLCIGQFVWTCHNERQALGSGGLLLAVGGVALVVMGFEGLRTRGTELAEKPRIAKRVESGDT